ncbi:MAG: ABC transporter permease [Helicobacteraceae bacterium]|nr:ABC transporter permease [Candidatus Sulfurimonas ponti]
MLGELINRIGAKTVYLTLAYYEAVLFTSLCVLNILSPRSYNSQIRAHLISQFYQTSVKVIPHFMLMAAIFGSVVVGLLIVIAADFSLQVQVGALIVTFVINELAPLLTAFFIAYRFSAFIHKQASSLHLDDEIQALHNLIIPRILSTSLSTMTLSILFSIIMIVSGYLSVFFIMGMDLHTYKYLIFSSLNVHNIFILLGKSALFGFIAATVPLYKGLHILKPKHKTSKVFVILFFIEFLSLFIQKAIDAI